jgi:serine/threonine-protein kinase
MEYLDGRDLRAELKLRSVIPYPEAVADIVQACEGLAAVHETGVIHRDLKPSNLFVTNLTGARLVKVLDFGVAKVLAGSESSLTGTDSTVGPNSSSIQPRSPSERTCGRSVPCSTT